MNRDGNLFFFSLFLVPKIEFEEIKQTLHSLATLIPNNEFYKYNDLWSRSTQQAVFLIIFESYLQKGEIINIIPVVEETLGGKNEREKELNTSALLIYHSIS